MKNEYARKLQIKKAQEISDAHKAGFDFACYLLTVGLNELFGFGADRLKKLEQWCNDVMENEFGKDIEVASYGLKRRIEQIMGRE